MLDTSKMMLSVKIPLVLDKTLLPLVGSVCTFVIKRSRNGQGATLAADHTPSHRHV